MKSVCIANACDFDRMGRWQSAGLPASIRRLGGRSLRRFGLKAMTGSTAFADMALYWSRQDCLLIAPPGLDPALIAYSDRLMNRNPTQIVPISVDAGMGATAASDPQVVRQIIEHLDGDEGELHAWGATEDLYDLVDAVTSAGGRLRLSEAPAKDDFALVQELDSKTGFRRLVDQLQTHSVRMRMPEGHICSSRQELAPKVEDFLRAHGECVVKSNFGSGGFGVLVVEATPGQSVASAVKGMEKAMNRRPSAFHTGPYIVERRIVASGGSDRTAGATSVLALIDEQTTVRVVGWAREIRDQANRHVGAVLARGIDDQSLKCELYGQATAIAHCAAGMGYRGYLGVDFLVDRSGSAYAIEINPRRCCSESTTYDIGEALYGAGWDQQRAALLRLPLPIQAGTSRPAAVVLNALESANQELAPDGHVVPLSLSWLKHAHPGIGYVLFMPDRSGLEPAQRVLLSHLRLAGVDPVAASHVLTDKSGFQRQIAR